MASAVVNGLTRQGIFRLAVEQKSRSNDFISRAHHCGWWLQEEFLMAVYYRLNVARLAANRRPMVWEFKNAVAFMTKKLKGIRIDGKKLQEPRMKEGNTQLAV